MTQTKKRYGLSTLLLTAITAAAAGAVVTAVVIASLTPATEAPVAGPTAGATPGATTAAPAPQVPDLARRVQGDPLAIGSVDAPVVMIEYSDYRCPYCSLFSRDILPTLIDTYVADGTLRIEWRDLPIFGEQSEAAAMAGRAAGEQGKFWEYQHALHAEAPERGHPDLPREKLIALASAAGVPDLAAFETAMDNPAHAQAIGADVREAQSLGITGTPAFLIGGEAMSGMQPMEIFQAAIERQAARP
ncbi:DsbA family protein [Mycetocola spongiae]|uniref:DsbA family protein n=1 Tax=Mycetocola spongiae TaxID=2859226 RepID=UPI001CF5AC96|nr:thioredoxin domain-containing protein [Mycetocola spongiae]UCR88884.1 thioredoxin domain-containing protein [Mycetocola spongiae]